jgi:hypothetical protein
MNSLALFYLRMCKLLARDLRKLGDQLDIVSGDGCEKDDE